MADEPDASGILNNNSTQFKISVLWNCHKNRIWKYCFAWFKTLNAFINRPNNLANNPEIKSYYFVFAWNNSPFDM